MEKLKMRSHMKTNVTLYYFWLCFCCWTCRAHAINYCSLCLQILHETHKTEKPEQFGRVLEAPVFRYSEDKSQFKMFSSCWTSLGLICPNKLAGAGGLRMQLWRCTFLQAALFPVGSRWVWGRGASEAARLSWKWRIASSPAPPWTLSM